MVVIPKYHFIVDALNYMSICINALKKKPVGAANLIATRRKCLDNLMYKLVFHDKKKKNPVHVHICAKYSTAAQLGFWEKVNHDYSEWFNSRYFTLYAILSRPASSVKQRVKEPEASFAQRKHAVESPDDYLVIALYNYYSRMAAAAAKKKKIDPEWTKQHKRPASSSILSVTVVSEDKYRDAAVIVDEVSKLLLLGRIIIKFAPGPKTKKIMAFAQRFSPTAKAATWTLRIPCGKIKKNWIPREDSSAQ